MIMDNCLEIIFEVDTPLDNHCKIWLFEKILKNLPEKMVDSVNDPLYKS
jgi:hypothetical protein